MMNLCFPPQPRWWVLVFKTQPLTEPSPTTDFTPTTSHQRLHTNDFAPTTSHQQLHTNDFTPTTSHQRLHTNNFTPTTSHQRLHTNDTTPTDSTPIDRRRYEYCLGNTHVHMGVNLARISLGLLSSPTLTCVLPK